MFHRSLSASRLLRASGRRTKVTTVRHSSSASGGGSGVKPMGVAAAVSSAGVGGVIGYAFFDPEFRKSIEKNVPGASEVFSSLLGPSAEPTKSTPSKPSPPKLKVTRIPEKEVIEAPKVASVLTTTPSKMEPTLSTKKKEASPSEQLPKDAFKEELSIEGTLKEKMASMISLFKEASEAISNSNETNMSYLTLLRKAMERTVEGDDSSWDEVFNAASLKREAAKKAGELMEKSNGTIKELIDMVESGKKELESKGILGKAEEEIKKAVEDLQSLSDKMIEAQKSTKNVEEFRNMVEKGKKAIQQVIASIIPPGGPESKENFDVFILYSHKKILSLQQEIAKLKTLEQQKFNQVVEDLRVEKSMDAQNTIQSALDTQRIEFEKEINRSKTAVREEMEAELRTQLKRQAAAHFDHLNDTREIQEKEISRKYQRELHETLLKENNSQKTEMSKMTGAYEGLVSALEKRGNADENILNAQNLWLSATHLYQRVLKGGIPLKSEVEELKKHISSDEDKQFIEAVLVAMDSNSLEHGVSSEEEMRHRFIKVERLAKQTAMIGSEGASPLVYFLSYLQSKFIRSQDTLRAYTDEVDLDSLDTHDITDLARFSLDRGNVEMAVKYMTLLKGKPMGIAKDWIQDARRVIEVKQACEAIIAQASSSGVQFPSK